MKTAEAKQGLAKLLDRAQLRWWEAASYVVLMAAAAAMRLWDLGSRAMHHDESLHAFFSWMLSVGDGYRHSPMMHGPFQFEANAGIFLALGDSDFTSRLLYAVAGTALVGMPLLLRPRLGRVGAVVAAVLLTASPTLLYFSRFARNDIIMAVWTLGTVIAMWRYLDEGKDRYLYIASALLAFMFATKETSFLIIATLGLFLFLTVVADNWGRVGRRMTYLHVSPPVAFFRMAGVVWDEARRGIGFWKSSRPFTFMLLMVTLTLPQWSAFASLLQDSALLGWTNLVLASTGADGSPIGAPVGGGLVLAVLIVLTLLGVSVSWGLRWSWAVWLRCALIFYLVWGMLYSTFLTNLGGIASGGWRSLGYWIVQQDEARGGQPWYYYLVIGPVYEFLPLLFGVLAALYYLARRDRFGIFLVYWAAATFVLHTIASEKMPWLLVGIALPLFFLSGKFMADLAAGLRWRDLTSGVGVVVLTGAPLLLLLLWQLALYETGRGALLDVLIPVALGAAAALVSALALLAVRRVGHGKTAALAALPLLLLLLGLSLHVGWRASYRNGEKPVEMLVYTQTTPQVLKLLREIESLSGESELGEVGITIDATSGFSWPWAWYLRGRPVGYPCYLEDEPGCAAMQEAPTSHVLVVHSQNKAASELILSDSYGQGERVPHRWWFPEHKYRGLTAGKLLRGLVDRDAWRSAMGYFLYRTGVEDGELASEDAYRYYSERLPPGS